MKLLIADDHTLFRDALVQYIERSNPTSMVVLAKDFYEALDLLKQDPEQDLVILDLRMPGMDGMQGFLTLKDLFPALRVALMSGVAEDEDVKKALDIGAVGYFPKTMSGRALLAAIEQVVAGDKYIPAGENSTYMPSYYADSESKLDNKISISTGPKPEFTPRESEVLSYLLDGASNKEIARALDLQVVTVKLHVRGICRKLSAKNRTQAALKAKEMGIQPVSLM
ncbi:MAG: response regulator transcription factor [Alphaproteobacteria bacterium]|nr:response regulator transcription factor [Alphaproteobacteria bacterium]